MNCGTSLDVINIILWACVLGDVHDSVPFNILHIHYSTITIGI